MPGPHSDQLPALMRLLNIQTIGTQVAIPRTMVRQPATWRTYELRRDRRGYAVWECIQSSSWDEPHFASSAGDVAEYMHWYGYELARGVNLIAALDSYKEPDA